jgi:hypothetical protein
MMKSPYFGMQESIIRRWRKIATLGRLCQRIRNALKSFALKNEGMAHDPLRFLCYAFRACF